MHASVKAELDNLALQFPGQSQIDLLQYAELYKIDRRYASKHLKRKKIPVSREGREIYISMLDLAIYKAKCKAGNTSLMLSTVTPADMNNRRGFNQMAAQRQMGK